jgi:acyl-coenzyme A synthetase/AMP-(fatty) acid ligase
MIFYKKFHSFFRKKKIFINDITTNKSITYDELFKNSIKLGNYFIHNKGIKSGDTILVKLEHSSLFYEILIASAIIGAKVCPVSPKINRSKFHKIKKLINNKLEITSTKDVCYSSVKDIPKNFYKLNFNQEYLIIFSSGTTSGEPKGIVHSLGSLISSAENFSKLCRFKNKDIFYAFWPLHYMAGIFNLFFVPLVNSSTIIFNSEFKIFLIKQILDVIKRKKITQLLLTPTMCSSIINFKSSILKNFSFGKKINIISTSNILYPETSNKFERVYKKKIHECYGVTELGGSITINYSRKSENYCVGIFSKKIKIKCQGSKKIPKEIFIKSDFMMTRYINKKLNIKNFFKTGDIGYFKNNKLYVLGRSEDNIKIGGEFVSLAEIENIALSIKGVKNVIAVPKKNEFFGFKINLYVELELNYNNKEIENKIISLFNNSLSKNEMPENIKFVKKIKKTLIGKNIKYFYR